MYSVDHFSGHWKGSGPGTIDGSTSFKAQICDTPFIVVCGPDGYGPNGTREIRVVMTFVGMNVLPRQGNTVSVEECVLARHYVSRAVARGHTVGCHHDVKTGCGSYYNTNKESGWET